MRRCIRERQLGETSDQANTLEDTGLDRLAAPRNTEDSGELAVEGDWDVGAMSDAKPFEDRAHRRSALVGFQGAVDSAAGRDHHTGHWVLGKGQAHLDGSHARRVTVRHDRQRLAVHREVLAPTRQDPERRSQVCRQAGRVLNDLKGVE